MKNTSVIISTYTADVSGVCSALYELGGMVVIHDPSGCNSTYNTHDEPRWYDQDSLIFISGLSEIDAIMGSDDKFTDDIIRAAKQLRPRFIALVQTPVPMMTGVDFEGIRDILARETGVDVFFFPTNGMHSYIQGVNMALAAVAEDMVSDVNAETGFCNRKAQGRKKINLLGVTPLDFSVNDTFSSIKRIISASGFFIQSCFAMGSTPEEISCAGEAHANLVVSSAGMEAAQVLFKRFQIPYVVGLPTGKFAEKVMEALEESIRTGENIVVYRDFASRVGIYAGGQRSTPENFRITRNKLQICDQDSDKAGTRKERSLVYSPDQIIYIIGEPVAVQSIRKAVFLEYGLNLRVLCYLEIPEGLLGEGSLSLSSEDEVREQLKDADIVIADPMYRPICPESAEFVPFPHEAFSGRIYRRNIPDLTKPEGILYNS